MTDSIDTTARTGNGSCSNGNNARNEKPPFKVTALIPCAGKGARMGTPLPKQYQTIDTHPIIALTLCVLDRHPLITAIILITAAEYSNYIQKEIIQKYGFSKITHIIPGGKERQDSVWNGLQIIDNDTDIVLIHDAVRPFASSNLITQTINAARESHAAIPAIPVKPTIKMSLDHQFVSKTLDRKTLYDIQTPQCFHYQDLLRAYEQAYRNGICASDDAMITEQYGIPVKLVPGEEINIKITTHLDMVLALYIYTQHYSLYLFPQTPK